MYKYRVFWLSGKVEILTGHDIADAFRRAGYSTGAICAIDFYARVSNK